MFYGKLINLFYKMVNDRAIFIFSKILSWKFPAKYLCGNSFNSCIHQTWNIVRGGFATIFFGSCSYFLAIKSTTLWCFRFHSLYNIILLNNIMLKIIFSVNILSFNFVNSTKIPLYNSNTFSSTSLSEKYSYFTGQKYFNVIVFFF